MLKKHLIIAIGFLIYSNAYAQFIPRDWTLQVTTTVQTNPPAITFSWLPIAKGTQVSIFRKAKTDLNFDLKNSIGTLPGTATTFTDKNIVVGQSYEYFIRGYGTDANPYIYVTAGVEVAQVDNKGKLILVVDNSFSSSLYTELNQLVADMTGDGWQVIRQNVERTATVPSVKALIKNIYDADPANVKAVYLFGHVPVPYSGMGGLDGHADHSGAWPADGYYADMIGVWTDNTVSTIQARRSENWNLIGDGKFDQSHFPSLPILQVGRVDMEDMPAFGVSEEVLLRRYLAKSHNFKHKVISAEPRAVIDNNFNLDPLAGDDARYASTAWLSFAPMFPPAAITRDDYFTTTRAGSYLWAYGDGGGTYTSAQGVGSTSNFAAYESKAVFNIFFGSYFGDWDSQNNFLRASLASNGWGLSACWGARPRCYYHHTALGENLGYSNLMTMSRSCYQNNIGPTNIQTNIGLMGDPTLRIHPVAPASNLVVSGTSLSWTASKEPVLGYCVYRQNASTGIFEKIKTTTANETSFTDSAPAEGVNYYMVRALKLEVSNSGSYKNLSQGIFGSSDNLPPSSPTNCILTNATNTSITFSWTSSTDNGQIVGYEVYNGGKFMGFTATNSYSISSLYPSTAYPITLIAKDLAGNFSAPSSTGLLSTSADIISPSAPTGLGQKAPIGNNVAVFWKRATDNIGVTGYEVYKDGALYGTTRDTTYVVNILPSVNYAITVIANDSAGNKSEASQPLNIRIGLYAYEGFVGSVNSGYVWGGNWNKSPAINASGLTFEGLQVAGGKLGSTGVNMTRPINLTIADGDSLCISYLCSENGTDLSFILSSAAGGIGIRNGKFQGDVIAAVQENSYTVSNIGGTDGIFTTPASVAGKTSFNFIVIKRTGAEFELKRWVYFSNLPHSMPSIGDVSAFTSGSYSSSALGYLTITGIKLLCRNGVSNVYYDEFRLGQSFEDVVPRLSTSLVQNKLENLSVYTVDGKLIADLSQLSGNSKITVFNANGALLKSIDSNGIEKLTINIPTKGIYLVSVLNGGKLFNQKVILF